MLQSEPRQLPDVLLCRQWSYFSFIPPRFGHLEALDDAFRCLITIAHSVLVPEYKRSNGMILGYYGKALSSLQSAVNEPKSYAQPACWHSARLVDSLADFRL
jgi:hypothetical protein